MYDHSSTRWLLVLAANLMFIGGGLPAFAQGPLPSVSSSRSNRDPDPNESIKRHESGSRSSGNSLEVRKSQAIQAGNDARRRFDYKTALDAYSKVKELDPKDTRAYYGLGNVYYDVACYDSAIDFYGQALQYNPNYVDAMVQLATSYFGKNRFDDAESHFAAALKLKPNRVDAKLGSLHVKAKKGNAREAIAGINQLIADQSIGKQERASAYIVLGQVYSAESRWQEAITAIEKAISINPDPAEPYVIMGIWQLDSASSKYDLPEQVIRIQDKEELAAAARLASENIRKAIYQKNYHHPYGYLFLSRALSYQYNYQAALSKLDTYFEKLKELEKRVSFSRCDLAFNAFYAHGYLWKADVFIRQAANETNKQRKEELQGEAINILKKATEIKQDFAFAYTRLGILYVGQRRYEEAIEQYKKALPYQTNVLGKATIYSGLGYAYKHTGPDDEAIYYLKKAIELTPDEGTNYLALAQIYEKRGDFDEAIRLSKEAIARERPPSLPLHYFLAGSYFVRAQKTNSDADYEEAVKLLKEVIKANNTFVDAYLALGNVYKFYKQGTMVNEAIANYEHALKYDPKNPAIYFMLGDLHASVTHNYDAAIKYLNEAIELKPDYALAYWTLAQVYREKKDDAEAIRLYLEGLKYWKNVNAYFMLVDIYEAQQNYVEATRWVQEAIRAEPTTHLPYVIKARLLSRQRKNDEAIHTYEEAIKWLKPDDSANKQLYLCRIIRLREQYPEALACFLKLTHPFPDQVPYDLGVTYVYSGNKQAALAQHQRLVQLKSLLAEDLLKKIDEME